MGVAIHVTHKGWVGGDTPSATGGSVYLAPLLKRLNALLGQGRALVEWLGLLLDRARYLCVARWEGSQELTATACGETRRRYLTWVRVTCSCRLCVMGAGHVQRPSDEQGKREEWSDILCPSDNGAWVSVSLCQT